MNLEELINKCDPNGVVPYDCPLWWYSNLMVFV